MHKGRIGEKSVEKYFEPGAVPDALHEIFFFASLIMKKYTFLIRLLLSLLLTAIIVSDVPGQQSMKLAVSENLRFLQHANGQPFFWLGDTGWYLFNRLTREEAIQYLDNRAAKEFNVIQCMCIPYLPLTNAYGDSAFINNNIAQPLETPGNDFRDSIQYDYWDHVSYIIDEAAKRNMYIGLVVIWGNVAKQKECTQEKVDAYTTWLVKRFGGKPNIIWINGGDLKGSIVTEKWLSIGRTLRQYDTLHLITYHPFGRTQSSTWFHNESWLDFNMFQSGHRRYDQKKGDGEDNWKGEDNWRYVLEDYAKMPPTPVLDGEPSYENIPQGLHDTTQPYWTAADCRRYAYWSVFAGSFGHTYGDNAVFQMLKPGMKPAYGARNFWYQAIDDSASFQMKYVKRLILSRPYFERVFDSTIVVDQSVRYDFVPVTRGVGYLFAYTYTGRNFTLRLGKISGNNVKVYWYNPSTGESTYEGTIANHGEKEFNPPGEKTNGNDWVLVLDDAAAGFASPGK